MRQVPALTRLRQPFTAPLPNVFLQVFTCLMASTGLLSPSTSFLFFDAHSPVAAHLSWVQRSHAYGLSLSLNALAAWVAHLIINTLSDRYGRKIGLGLAQLGIILWVLLSFYAAYQHQLGWMIAGLICFNLLNTSKSSALASIADQPSPNTQKNMAWLQGMIATAIFITAPLGGWLAHQTWQGHRFMAAFPVALCLACLSLFLLQNTQDTLNTAHRQPLAPLALFSNLKQLLRQPRIRRGVIMLALSQCSWGAYFEFMPPLLKTQLHANPMHIGWFISLITVMLAITAFIISPYLTKKISPHQQQGIAIATLLAGCVCAASAGLLPAKPLTYNLFALSACLCACGDVLLYIMIVSDFATYAPKHCKGQMMGLDYLVVTLVWGGMGQLGGWILAHNPQKLLFLLPFGSLLLFIYWLCTCPKAHATYTAGA